MELRSTVGSRARNFSDDVILVQGLLNNFLPEIGRVYPIEVDGECGPKTITAIYRFQKWKLGLTIADSRVDPDGLTFHALTERGKPFEVLTDSNYHYSYCDRSEQWGESVTIDFIDDVSEELFRSTGAVLGVGHISKEFGGPFPPHRSHRIGFHVDVRPIRTDRANYPVSIVGSTAKFYDGIATRALVRIARRHSSFKSVLFNDISIPGVTPYSGHNNHLHFTIKP